MTAHLKNKPTALYRLFDGADQLLYVGITHDLEQRWEYHSYMQAWWHLVQRQSIEWFPNRPAAVEAERAAVATESPRFDATHRLGRGWLDHPRVAYEDPDEPRVAASLRAALDGDRFPHGRALPCLRDLASEFSTSISTVGSVLHGLVREGVLESGRRYWRVGERPVRPTKRTHWEPSVEGR